jgi:hypothetical protein
MQLFDLNELAFHVWDFAPFPQVLCCGAVHRSWNKRLSPYNSQNKCVSITSPNKLWMETLTSIHVYRLPASQEQLLQICAHFSNIREANVSDLDCQYDFKFGDEGLFDHFVPSVHKLICNAKNYSHYLYYPTLNWFCGALRELVILNKNDRSELFTPFTNLLVLKQITHFTVQGIFSTSVADLQCMPELQVLSVLLVQPTPQQVTTQSLLEKIFAPEFEIRFYLKTCKNLRLVRASQYLASVMTEENRSQLKTDNIEFEIVE